MVLSVSMRVTPCSLALRAAWVISADVTATIRCLAMWPCTARCMQDSRISRIWGVERAMRLTSAQRITFPAWVVTVRRWPTARSRQASRARATPETPLWSALLVLPLSLGHRGELTQRQE